MQTRSKTAAKTAVQHYKSSTHESHPSAIWNEATGKVVDKPNHMGVSVDSRKRKLAALPMDAEDDYFCFELEEPVKFAELDDPDSEDGQKENLRRSKIVQDWYTCYNLEQDDSIDCPHCTSSPYFF